MRPPFCACAVALVVAASFFAHPARADARGDAAAITERLINQTMVDAMFDSIGPLARQALQNSLGQGPGAGLSPGGRDVVISQFLNSMRATFLSHMRDEYVQIYMAEMSPSELAGLRAFLDTPAGTAFAAKQAALVRRGSEVGQRVGRTVGGVAAQQIAQRLADEGPSLIANPNDLAILRQLFPVPPSVPLKK